MMAMQIEKYVSKSSHTIAAQIVYFRRYRGMTQAQLAEAAGMDQPTIARLEKTPDMNWTMPTLAKLGSALDVRISADMIPNAAPGQG